LKPESRSGNEYSPIGMPAVVASGCQLWLRRVARYARRILPHCKSLEFLCQIPYFPILGQRSYSLAKRSPQCRICPAAKMKYLSYSGRTTDAFERWVRQRYEDSCPDGSALDDWNMLLLKCRVVDTTGTVFCICSCCFTERGV